MRWRVVLLSEAVAEKRSGHDSERRVEWGPGWALDMEKESEKLALDLEKLRRRKKRVSVGGKS